MAEMLKMKLVCVFAFLPLCLGQVTDDNQCVTLIPNFGLITSDEKPVPACCLMSLYGPCRF